MQLAIDTADPRPVHAQIVDEVRRAVVVGALRPGDPLPAVRTLAAQLRVNPGAVARAYRQMEAEGLASVRWGEGTFVAGAGASEDVRRDLVRAVAERALADARRHGLRADEVIEQIRAAAGEPPPDPTDRGR